MIPLIFRPIAIADKCFLSEALMWIAFCRPPLEIWGEHGDGRFEEDSYGDYEARPMGADYGLEEDATLLECRYAGLPSNPASPESVDDTIYSKGELQWFQQLRDQLVNDKKQDKIPEIDSKIKAAQEFEEKCARWDVEFFKYMEVPKSKLFIALRENKLKAFGRPLTHQDVDKQIAEFERNLQKDQHWSWHDIDFEEIPRNFWTFDRIEWMDSAARDGRSHYMHIYIDTEKLCELFPPYVESNPKVYEPEGKLLLVSGNMFWLDGDKKKIRKSSRMGRPSFDWDEFHLEITRRLQNDKVPDKQEAFIHDMRQWCVEKWGKPPGRSTISQKVSPYYTMFIRKKSESP